jgi:hypothetical protein
MLEGARVLDEGELKQRKSYGAGWVANLIREFQLDYADVPGLEISASLFGVSRTGKPRTAANIASAVNKYAESKQLNVLASSEGETLLLEHFDRSVQAPPRSRGRRQQDQDEVG